MIALVAAMLIGCAPQPASIKFDGEPTVTVHTLDAVAVNKATVLDTDGKAIEPQPALTWKVSPDTVAKLETTNVTPVGNGEATVEASVGTVKGSYKFVVALPDKIEIAGYSAPVGVGASAQLTAAVKAGETAVAGQTVTWSVEPADGTIATVDAAGIVTGVALGKAKVTATSGALSSSLEIEVGAAAPVADAAAAAEPAKQ